MRKIEKQTGGTFREIFQEGEELPAMFDQKLGLLITKDEFSIKIGG